MVNDDGQIWFVAAVHLVPGDTGGIKATAECEVFEHEMGADAWIAGATELWPSATLYKTSALPVDAAHEAAYDTDEIIVALAMTSDAMLWNNALTAAVDAAP